MRERALRISALFAPPKIPPYRYRLHLQTCVTMRGARLTRGPASTKSSTSARVIQVLLDERNDDKNVAWLGHFDERSADRPARRSAQVCASICAAAVPPIGISNKAVASV